MLDICTVSFFGHREVEPFLHVEKCLESIIKNLLETKEYVEFLVGRNGEFDQIVSSTIKRIKKSYRSDNSCHTLVLPYNTSEYRHNLESFIEYYDAIEIFDSPDNSHYKSIFQKRNRYMVDRSNMIVFYLERKNGGAYQTFRYAQKQKKDIYLLPLIDNSST